MHYVSFINTSFGLRSGGRSNISNQVLPVTVVSVIAVCRVECANGIGLTL